MKKSFYPLAFATTFTLSTGVLFKIFHWPAAGMILFTGFVLLNLVLLPVYFYQKYKSARP